MDAVHDGVEEGIEFEMKVTEIFKNDAGGRQIMEGAKIRELKVDNIMNSKEEFQQPGEIIPTLEGAGIRHNRNNNSNRNNANNRNNSNSQNSEIEVNSSQDIANVGSSSQGDMRRRKTNKKVTVEVGGTQQEGVTTRSRARRENIVV